MPATGGRGITEPARSGSAPAASAPGAVAGKPMTRVSVLAENPRLVNAATKHFPHSWARALRAAGVAP